MRALRSWPAVVSSLALALALGPAPAYAHTEALEGSTPAPGSVVRSLDVVELRFVDRVQVASATLTLRAADGASPALAAPTWDAGDRVATLRPAAEVPDGRYRVGYQVVFADAHPAAGVVEFEVSADGVARAPTWSGEAPPPVPPRERFDAGSALPGVAVGAAALLTGVSLLLHRIRRRERLAAEARDQGASPLEN